MRREIVKIPLLPCDPEINGAMALDLGGQIGAGCWFVFGKAVILTAEYMDIHKGFEIVNFNFHTNGTPVPVPDQYSLPGSSNSDTGGMLV